VSSGVLEGAAIESSAKGRSHENKLEGKKTSKKGKKYWLHAITTEGRKSEVKTNQRKGKGLTMKKKQKRRGTWEGKGKKEGQSLKKGQGKVSKKKVFSGQWSMVPPKVCGKGEEEGNNRRGGRKKSENHPHIN